MPGPAQSLCPKCGRNPRRRSGLMCNGCSAEYARNRRHAERAIKGKPKTGEPQKRFARPLDSKRYIITSAQNATPVHPEFFHTLEVAAKHLGAELVVVPFRYKNPTSVWSKNQESEERWAIEVAPYLFNVRKKLCPNLVLAADVKMQPTASSPVTGFESLTGGESCILGHPKMQLVSIPVPTGRFPKIITTTGACTRQNYTDTKAGKIGAFHHFLGAIIVEISGPKFHIRQVNADRTDGSFTDLATHYTEKGARPAPPALGLVLGDTHVRVTDPDVDRATFGKGGMVETLEPQTLVFHDLIDGETVNPHEVGDPFIAEAKRVAGRQDVRKEVVEVVEFVNTRAKGRQAVIVDSNHHDFLRRWIVRTDWRQDLKNARFYLETAQAMLRSAEMTPGGARYGDPFAYWVSKLGAGSNVRCLGPDESFKLADVECGMHGDDGPNGARGTIKNLARLGSKSISGHTHTPGIEEGAYQVGTSSMRRLAYQRGPSSHLNAHCVVYATGKRALLLVIEGRWKL